MAQQERVLVTTSPLARQLLTNTTAASWLQILGVGQISNLPTMGPAQIIVGNASGNPTAFNVTGVLSLDTNGVWTLLTNGVIPGNFIKGTVGADGRITSASATLSFTDIPSLPGSIIGSGTVLAARLPANVAFQDGINTFTGVDNFTGTLLVGGTNINTLFGTGGPGGGSVTQVAASGPSGLFSSWLGSPINTTGTLIPVLNTQTSNTFFRGPLSGGAGVPFFGPLVNADFSPGLLNDASNVWSGIQYFNGGFSGIGSNLQVNGLLSANAVTVTNAFTATGNRNVGTFSNLTLFANQASRGSLNWNNGSLTSIEDPNFLLFNNTAHGTTIPGNACEWQWTFNQLYLGPANGGHFQFGLNSDLLGDTFVLQWIGSSLTAPNRSHALGFHTKQNAGDSFMDMWSETYNTTNGGVWLHVTPSDGGGNQDWHTVEGVPVASFDQDSGFEVPGYIRRGFAVNSATNGTNYAINFTNQSAIELDIANNLNLSETNLNLVGHLTNSVVIEKDILIYPGIADWLITLPTNWVWETPAGTPFFSVPTTVTNSVIAHIKLLYTLGSTTNRIARMLYAPYVPVFDSNASNFLSAAGITNSTIKTAINKFVLNAKAHGYWSNLKAFYPTVGGTSNTCSWNLVATNNYRIAWTGGGLTFGANGVTGDGTASFGDTQFVPSTQLASATNSFAGINVRSPALPTDLGYFFGCNDGSNNRWGLWKNGANWQTTGMNANTIGDSVIGAGGSFIGYMSEDRVGTSAEYDTFQSSAAILDSPTPTAVSGLPTISCYILARQDTAGVADRWSNAQVNNMAIGTAFTPQNITDLQTDEAALNSDLGR